MCDDEKHSPPPSKSGDASWRRLNTLGTYGVMGNSLVALIPRQRQSLSYHHGAYRTVSD